MDFARVKIGTLKNKYLYILEYGVLFERAQNYFIIILFSGFRDIPENVSQKLIPPLVLKVKLKFRKN